MDEYSNKFKVACIRDDILTLKNIIHEVDINNEDFSGDTGLNLACRYGNIKVVKFLIYKGVDINYKNYHGITALMYACKGGYIDIVKLLIIHNADIKCKNNIGYNAFHYAFKYGYRNIINIFLSLDFDYIEYYNNVPIEQYQYVDTVRIRDYMNKFDEYKKSEEYFDIKNNFLSYKSSQIFIYIVLISDDYYMFK